MALDLWEGCVLWIWHLQCVSKSGKSEEDLIHLVYFPPLFTREASFMTSWEGLRFVIVALSGLFSYICFPVYFLTQEATSKMGSTPKRNNFLPEEQLLSLRSRPLSWRESSEFWQLTPLKVYPFPLFYFIFFLFKGIRTTVLCTTLCKNAIKNGRRLYMGFHTMFFCNGTCRCLRVSYQNR